MKINFNRITSIAIALVLFVAMHLSTALAQTTANGVIDRLTDKGIALSSGQAYTKTDGVTVTLPGERVGSWNDLSAGDKVRVSFNDKRQVVGVALLTKLVTQRVEQPLIESDDRNNVNWIIAPINGGAKLVSNAAISGRAFPKAFWNMDSEPIFPNYADYDVLDVWIGVSANWGGRRNHGICRILGDGEEIYRTPLLSDQDQAIHVIVPIKGFSGIKFDLISDENAIANWGNPIFIKLPSTIPNVVSPRTDERVTQITPFLWKPVENATGYLVEMQAVSLVDGGDENDVNRYVLLRLPAETTVYNFDANKMPKGKWRWRVHALNKTGFLGEMEGWRTFSSQ